MVEKKDPRGNRYYWIAGEEVVKETGENSDYEAVEERFISVTPIHLDLTNHAALPKIKRMFENGAIFQS